MFNRRYTDNRPIQKLIAFFLVLSTFFLIPKEALAVCPVCTVAVGAGLGLSRYLGIDDMISGIWVGGLMVSLTIWTAEWLAKKKFKIFRKMKFSFFYILSGVFYILITYPPLWYGGVIGHPFNTVLGIDKLIFGSVVGAGAFILGVWADKKQRKIRGKQLFPYQKVAFPVTSLIIFSLVLYFWGGYLK